ncbi:MAG: hypothetical protein WCD56_18015 [Pseudolabrys sp.]
MRRRNVLILLGGAVALTLPARAQQTKTMIVGFLHSASSQQYHGVVDAFRQGLNETGFIEAQNLAIEQRWAENQVDRLPALAAAPNSLRR